MRGLFCPITDSLHRSNLSGALWCLCGYRLVPRAISVGWDAASVDAGTASVSTGTASAGAGIPTHQTPFLQEGLLIGKVELHRSARYPAFGPHAVSKCRVQLQHYNLRDTVLTLQHQLPTCGPDGSRTQEQAVQPEIHTCCLYLHQGPIEKVNRWPFFWYQV